MFTVSLGEVIVLFISTGDTVRAVIFVIIINTYYPVKCPELSCDFSEKSLEGRGVRQGSHRK